MTRRCVLCGMLALLASAATATEAKPVAVGAKAPADGGLIERPVQRPARTDVTFNKQVSRILQKRCQSCHREEQAAPFALLTYEDAVRHARMIKEVTAQRRMPPWHADPRHG